MSVKGAVIGQVRRNPKWSNLEGRPALPGSLPLQVLIGFSRTYSVKGFFGTPPLSRITHLHGHQRKRCRVTGNGYIDSIRLATVKVEVTIISCNDCVCANGERIRAESCNAAAVNGA
jgi:hypothetical protein